jgi:sporulation protein YlmC with PRC-barrel domain
MLQKMMQDLQGDTIVARDGAFGSVKDAYFDDARWAVRYLVVDTGKWLPGRKVLISPISVAHEETNDKTIRVNLSRKQVERAPGTEDDPPASRQFEAGHARYYGNPFYWSGPYLWGAAEMPLSAPRVPRTQLEEEDAEARQLAMRRAEKSHLRSSAEVIGYRIRAIDGEIGHVEDFLVDDESWAIADMVVDTRNWLPGRKVLVPPSAIESVDWDARQVKVRLAREELKRAPEAP